MTYTLRFAAQLQVLVLSVAVACAVSSSLDSPGGTSQPPSASSHAPSSAPTEQDLLTEIHALEHRLRTLRPVLATLQDSRARRGAADAALPGQTKRDSEQVCALEDADGNKGECASPDEQFKLVGSRVLGYKARTAVWLPWAVSHASLFLCVAGDDGALHVYSRAGFFKASYALPSSCHPTSMDVSGFKTDVVALIAVGCADASFVIVSISGPPNRALPRFSAGSSAAFAAADASKLPSDTWIPNLSIMQHTPFPSSTNPLHPSIVVPENFYPEPPPSPPDEMRHVLAVHRLRVPSFFFLTGGGRVLLTSRNGTVIASGIMPQSQLPVSSALYLGHSFVFLATQQGAVVWDFRTMSVASSCTETVQEDMPISSPDKHAEFETRSVRRPFTSALIAATQEATAADVRSIHALDSRASIITFSVRVDRSRVKCHLSHELPGALPAPPPQPTITGLRGGFVASAANHINIFRAAAESSGTPGAILEIQMPIRSSSSSTHAFSSATSSITVADGAYVLATIAADGTLTMYQSSMLPSTDKDAASSGISLWNMFSSVLRSPMVLGGVGVVVYMKFFKKSSDKNLKGAARLGSWPNAATGTAMGDINSALGGKGPISEKWGDVSADNMHRTMMQHMHQQAYSQKK